MMLYFRCMLMEMGNALIPKKKNIDPVLNLYLQAADDLIDAFV